MHEITVSLDSMKEHSKSSWVSWRHKDFGGQVATIVIERGDGMVQRFNISVYLRHNGTVACHTSAMRLNMDVMSSEGLRSNDPEKVVLGAWSKQRNRDVFPNWDMQVRVKTACSPCPNL